MAQTTIPARPDEAEPEPRRDIKAIRLTGVLAVVGAAAAALALTTILFTQLAPFDGVLGFIVVAYLCFLGCYALLVSLDEDGPAVRDRVMSVLAHSLGFLTLLALAVVVLFTLWRGKDALSHLNFFTSDLALAGPLDPLTMGGVLHGVLGTLIEIGIALAITVPLGLVTAVFLAELPGTYARFVRTVVEAMTALPSIVAGLFVYATLILLLGVPKSGFAAATAISVMMLPIMIRAADVVLRLVPGNLREASLALGASQLRTVWHVVLPTARSGLTTAIILGTARGIGETSPVVLTAGFTAVRHVNPFDGPMASLPTVTFFSITSPQPDQIARGFGAGATLLVLVLLLFVAARVLGGRGPGQLSNAQRRRRARASRREERRFARRAGHRPRTTFADNHRSNSEDIDG